MLDLCYVLPLAPYSIKCPYDKFSFVVTYLLTELELQLDLNEYGSSNV